MSRTLSAGFRAAILSQSADEDAVALLTISHPELATPLRASSHPIECLGIDPLRYGTRSRGQIYDYIEFQITLPEDAEGKPPSFDIVMSNIARETIELIESTTEPALVTVEIVSIHAPDLVEIEWPDFDLASAEYEDETVRIGLALDALATEPYPADAFTPAGFRGLF